MEDHTREHLVDGSIWLRGLQMLVLAIGYNVVEAMLALTTIFQFFCALITGSVNEPLLRFAKNGSIYVQEVFEFLTFNSEIRPFPFTEWPNEPHTGEEWLEAEADSSADQSVEPEVESEIEPEVEPEVEKDDKKPE
ncbi:MAG: hypothetical protein NPIRA05_22680 [Nitrospirales bacterium]|nr:MAG: hypothetical protein NPIRA05_22680 [Nitrospirales bacterium]